MEGSLLEGPIRTLEGFELNFPLIGLEVQPVEPVTGQGNPPLFFSPKMRRGKKEFSPPGTIGGRLGMHEIELLSLRLAR